MAECPLTWQDLIFSSGNYALSPANLSMPDGANGTATTCGMEALVL
jgi:hypothetical protein